MKCKRLEKYKQAGLGLEFNKVRLSSHNHSWKRMYSNEAYLIFEKLKIESLRLHHIGSTSVNIMAKPIIDIAASIDSFEFLSFAIKGLETLGHQYKGEFGIKNRHFFILNDEDNCGYIHLHLFKKGDPKLETHLNFRSYLIERPTLASEYSMLKSSLNVSRQDYSSAKNQFVEHVCNLVYQFFPKKESKKTLAFLGSAKGGRNTRDFLLESYEHKNLEIIDLCDHKIMNYEYNKASQDDFLKLIIKIKDAQRIVFATPVYWYSMSGTMKVFIDRFSELLSVENSAYSKSLVAKELDLIVTGNDTELPLGFSTPFNLFAIYFGIDFKNVFYKKV